MKKLTIKLIAMLTVIVTVFLMFSNYATISAESETVTITMNVQAEGMFILPYGEYEVSADLSDKYGYSERIADGVSALDALIRAHEVIFGTEDFTPETATSYLDFSNGWLASAFSIDATPSFLVNGTAPNDGVYNESFGAYTGYAADQAKITDNDFVEFFFYVDPYYLDNYAWFEKSGNKVDSITVMGGENFSLNLNGYCFAYYGCSTQETIDTYTSPISNAKIATVDENGVTTTVENAITDEEGIVTLNFETPGEYLVTAYVDGEYDIPCIMPTIKVTVLDPASYVTASVKVPSCCDVEVGSIEKSFVITNLDSVSIETVDDSDLYSYYVKKESSYFYRVSGENMVTYADKIFIEEDSTFEVTDEMLYADGSKTSNTIIRDFSNNSYDVADVYLNINEKGHLVLEKDCTYQIVNIRNWQLIESISNILPIEPDYHYTVIDENGALSDNVITIDENGLITAVGNGTAIVLVTYDAITYNSAYGGGALFSAIWPENTGVFVVSVGQDSAEIDTGMYLNQGFNTTTTKLAGNGIDAEIDVLYYLEGTTGAEYSFKPEDGATVSVLRPVITDNKLSYSGGFTTEGVSVKDGTYTVSDLSEGRNIIKVTVGVDSVYQVVTVKELSYDVNITDNIVTVTFDRVYHPANKLAGIYNMNARIYYYNDDTLIKGATKQYNFASDGNAQKITFEIPDGYEKDTITLTNGNIYTSSWGSPYGAHRYVTYTEGKNPNLSSVSCVAYLGRLPDITISLSKEVLLGDVNNDGEINVSDVVLLTEYIGTIAAGGTLSATKFPNGTLPGGENSAKLTADDSIDVNDVVLMVEYIATKAAGGNLDSDRFPNSNFPSASL